MRALTAEGTTTCLHKGAEFTHLGSCAGLAMDTLIMFEVRETDIALDTMAFDFFGNRGGIFRKCMRDLAKRRMIGKLLLNEDAIFKT